MATTPSTKPYVKLAYGLILFGMGIFTIERLGLSNLSGPNSTGMHLDGTLLSIMVIAPFVLVISGVVIFMFGKMRRL
jgi:hypothetical protein